jgi:glutamate synthase (NADPH/NADH) small chain
MTARDEEEKDARAEGVVFRFRTEPVAFIGDAIGRLVGVRFRRLEEEITTGASGRRRVFAVPDSEFEVPASVAVIAVGYDADPLLREATEGLTDSAEGFLHTADDGGHQGRRGIFAGGDVVHGEGLVVTAMAAGRRAAKAIDAYLRGLDHLAPEPVALPEGAATRRGRWTLRR